jgi:hypothetical protein
MDYNSPTKAKSDQKCSTNIWRYCKVKTNRGGTLYPCKCPEALIHYPVNASGDLKMGNFYLRQFFTYFLDTKLLDSQDIQD